MDTTYIFILFYSISLQNAPMVVFWNSDSAASLVLGYNQLLCVMEGWGKGRYSLWQEPGGHSGCIGEGTCSISNIYATHLRGYSLIMTSSLGGFNPSLPLSQRSLFSPIPTSVLRQGMTGLIRNFYIEIVMPCPLKLKVTFWMSVKIIICLNKVKRS